jgi:hypothetical protein
MSSRSWMTGVGCALAFLAPVGALAAEGDQLQATIGKPAVVTATPASTAMTAPADQPRVVINVIGFRPAQDGSVQAVVKAQKADGTEQEVGRFALFPQAEFKADAAAAVQRYSIPLPRELAGGGPVKLKVELLPMTGKGEGARLEVGGAEIR